MGLFAIDVMAGSGAHPLLVIAAPNEAEAIAVCEMQRKLGDSEYREVFGEGTFIGWQHGTDAHHNSSERVFVRQADTACSTAARAAEPVVDALAGKKPPAAETGPQDCVRVAFGTLPGREFGTASVGALPRGCLGVLCHPYLRSCTESLCLIANAGNRGGRLLEMPRHDLTVYHGRRHVLTARLTIVRRDQANQAD